MEPICCLLGLCCPPAEREERVTAMFMSWGAEQNASAVIARRLIAVIDASPLGHFLKAVVAHVKHD